MKTYLLMLCALSGSFAGCQETTAPTPSAGITSPGHMPCQTTPTALDIRDNGKGRILTDAITLEEITLTPNMVGYGPALNPKAEITILDGKMYLTKPEGTETITTTTPTKDQGASFIVYESVDAWQEVGTFAAIEDLLALSQSIGKQAQTLGCTKAAVFPYKIKGRAKIITWSITGAPKGMKGTLENVDVVVVGLYDNRDVPRNAIMPNLNIHPHAVIDNGTLSGHVNAIELAAGATLYVPQQQGN